MRDVPRRLIADPPVTQQVIAALRHACQTSGRDWVLVSGCVHPHLTQACEAALEAEGIEFEVLAPDPFGLEDLLGRIDNELAAVLMQSPTLFGHIGDLTVLSLVARGEGCRLVIPAEITALGIMPPLETANSDAVIIPYGTPTALPIRHLQDRAEDLAARLRSEVRGLRLIPRTYFSDFALRLPLSADGVADALAAHGITAALPMRRLHPSWPELDEVMLISTLSLSDREVESLATALIEILSERI